MAVILAIYALNYKEAGLNTGEQRGVRLSLARFTRRYTFYCVFCKSFQILRATMSESTVSSQPKTPDPKELPCFSRSEVLKHNRKSDCWLIIGNGVYDFTDFLKRHPGGSDILLARAGEDATTYFISKHAGNKAVMRQLERLRIGELTAADRLATDDFTDPFMRELVDLTYSEKLYELPQFWKNRYFWIRAANIAVFFTCSLLALYGGLPWWLAIILVMAQAVVGTSLFGFVAHEATHRNYPKSKPMKWALNITWSVFWPFIPQNPLRYEHNSHHIKIGDPHYDFEVAAFAPFIRYSGLVTPKPLHKYQHRLAKYLYPFYANIITTIGGMRSGFWDRHNRKPDKEHVFFIGVTLLYYLVLPAVFGANIFWLAALYLVYQCTLFYGIYVGSAINHFVPEVAREIPEEQRDNYPYYVCHNTTNFCLDKPFWFWFTGGFNVQIEHHLIPFIPVDNLRKMVPIVQGLCRKYGVPYYNFPSVSKLWNAHYDYLRALADEHAAQALVAREVANKQGYHAR